MIYVFDGKPVRIHLDHLLEALGNGLLDVSFLELDEGICRAHVHAWQGL
jgi:hypothetical protein